MPWNFKRYGSATDPIHKSHLNAITGDYGCPKKFRYEQDARADHKAGDDERREVSGKAAAGTAAHETIARALTNPDAVAKILLGPDAFSRDQIRAVYDVEYAREVGGRTTRWNKEDAGDVADERVWMIYGLLNRLHERVARIELVEPGFIAPIGEYWLSGHIDLVYRPKSAPDTIAITDWKTGASKPDEIELDHGWEAGVYSTAVCKGVFLPREQIKVSEDCGVNVARIGKLERVHASRYIAEREVLEAALIELAALDGSTADHPGGYDIRAFREFPALIHHVHLGDFVPYRKAGAKEVKRPEDLKHYGYVQPTKHKYTAGELRGPAWLPVKLSEYDLPRLESRLRNVVGSIRMGRFIDQVGERCKRCSFKGDCLTGGYAPTGDARKSLERTLRMLPSEALDVDMSFDE